MLISELSLSNSLKLIHYARIIAFGVGHRLEVASPLHCVESALWRSSAYYRRLFFEQICYSYETAEGEIGTHCYQRRSGAIYTPKVARHFAPHELIEDCLDGLEVYAISAPVLIERPVALRREGKSVYISPITWPWYFRF